MKHDEWESAMRLARAEVEADVLNVLDELTENGEDVGADPATLEIVRLRCTAIFTSQEEDDDE